MTLQFQIIEPFWETLPKGSQIIIAIKHKEKVTFFTFENNKKPFLTFCHYCDDSCDEAGNGLVLFIKSILLNPSRRWDFWMAEYPLIDQVSPGENDRNEGVPAISTTNKRHLRSKNNFLRDTFRTNSRLFYPFLVLRKSHKEGNYIYKLRKCRESPSIA